MKGADSAARFSAGLARAAGYDIGARYVNQSFGTAELADYRANGLILLPIYETSGRPTNFADGANQGSRARDLLNGLGLSGYGCAFTDDVSGASYDTVREWVRGIRSTFPWHLVYYGPSHHGDRLVDDGLADSVWIEGAWSFSPGYNPRNPQPPTARHACGVQYPTQPKIGGVTVDFNDFFSTPWLPGGKTTAAAKDWFDMADKKDLEDVVDARNDTLLAALGSWEKDTRKLLGRQAMRQDGDPAQYYLDAGPTGAPVRVHIPSPAVLELLKKTGYVDDVPEMILNGDGNDPVTAWFLTLPVVEMA